MESLTQQESELTAHPNDRYHPEDQRIRAARDEAEAEGRELLTPRAAAELFGKASQTVRQAVRLQQVDAPYTLNATGKPVSLLLVDSALKFWRDVPEDFYDRLTKMRAEAHTLSIYGVIWNILSLEPLASLRDPGAME